MPKGYMISAHRSEADPVKRAAYLEIAEDALIAAGGRFLAYRQPAGAAGRRPWL